MPKCMHAGHKRTIIKDPKDKVKDYTEVKGYNPIHKRFEWCDEGLVYVKPRRTVKKRKVDKEDVSAH